MKNYTIEYIDYVGAKCKNLQILNTIEIFYYITINNKFGIEYNFHHIDFDLWKEIIEIHTKDVDNPILYNNEEIISLKELQNSKEYYTFQLISKDFNLYRNINLILYLSKNNWNNSEEMIRKNTWNK